MASGRYPHQSTRQYDRAYAFASRLNRPAASGLNGAAGTVAHHCFYGTRAVRASVLAGLDDASQNEDGGFNTAIATTVAGDAHTSPTGRAASGMRFALDVPQGMAIDTATLDLTTGKVDDPHLEIFAGAVDDSEAFGLTPTLVGEQYAQTATGVASLNSANVWQPVDDHLVLVFVAMRGSAANAEVSSVTGHGLSFARLHRETDTQGVLQAEVWQGRGTVEDPPTSGNTTVTFTGTAYSSAVVTIAEFVHADDVSGTQVNGGDSGAVNDAIPSVTYVQGGVRLHVGFFAHTSSVFTQAGGYSAPSNLVAGAGGTQVKSAFTWLSIGGSSAVGNRIVTGTLDADDNWAEIALGVETVVAKTVTGQLGSVTSASVSWDADNIGASSAVRSPDFAAVIEEVVGRPGWVPGNHVTVFIQGHSDVTSPVTFNSWDHATSAAPALNVTYSDALPALQAALSGSSTSTGSLAAGLALPAALAGTGSSTGSLAALLTVAAEIAGSSTSTGALPARLTMAAALAGASTSSASLDATRLLPVALSGTSTSTGSFPARLVMAASLSGTSTATGTLTGLLTADAAILGTSTTTGSLAGSLLMTAAFSDASASTGALAAATASPLAFSGSSTTTGALAVHLVMDLRFWGTPPWTGGSSFRVRTSRVRGGDRTRAGSPVGSTGSLDATIPVVLYEAALSGASTATGSLAASLLMAGDLAGTSATSGSLDVRATLLTALTGTSTSGGGITAGLAVQAVLAGSGASTGNLAATLLLASAFSGSSVTTGSVSVEFVTALHEAALTGSSASSGSLSVSTLVRSVLAGSGTSSGSLAVSLTFAAVLAGSGTTSGQAAAVLLLSAALSGSSTSDGTIAAGSPYFVAVSGSSVSSGSFAVGVPIISIDVETGMVVIGWGVGSASSSGWRAEAEPRWGTNGAASGWGVATVVG